MDETLVIWGGEFGRTPFIQGNLNDRPRWGRDHHPYAFTMWMAGAGVRPGLTYGASDDLAMNVAENPVHVRSQVRRQRQFRSNRSDLWVGPGTWFTSDVRHWAGGRDVLQKLAATNESHLVTYAITRKSFVNR